MNGCTRKILIIFGLLLLIVIMLVPYRSTQIKFKVDSFSLAKYKITSHQSGYMFVFKYLKLKSNKRSVPGTDQEGTDQDSYVLNKTLFLIELIIVIVLAFIDYFLFCIILKKRKVG
jgi:hypothetical protein